MQKMQPIDLIQGARTRLSRPFIWMGVAMYGNPNPDPPESLAIDVMHLRKLVIRLEKTRDRLIDNAVRDKLLEFSTKIGGVAEECEALMLLVNDAWTAQDRIQRGLGDQKEYEANEDQEDDLDEQ